MGWKNVKEHYKIEHIVQVTNKGICIGSPYIHDIIVIGMDGTFVKKYDFKGVNKDLSRYQHEMDADLDKLKQLVLMPDTFERSIEVYTYAEDCILLKQCEELGYPHVTYDGKMMYENTFSTDKEKIIKRAKECAEARIDLWQERCDDIAAEYAKAESELEKAQKDLQRLDSDYPGVMLDEKEN